jgi:ElaB/YqjD/DUF883 family membrane-anchored ribosome-binding protein
MTTPSATTKTYGPQATNGGDPVAAAFDHAAKSAQNTVDNALDSVSNKVEDIRSQATPLIDRVSAQATAAAKRGVDAVRDTSQQLREKAVRASDTTVAYVKDEPIKAVLIAAATGALLMGLVGLLRRSRPS